MRKLVIFSAVLLLSVGCASAPKLSDKEFRDAINKRLPYPYSMVLENLYKERAVASELRAPASVERGLTSADFSHVLFTHDGSFIRADQLGVIQNAANLLLDNPNTRVRLDGHTDTTGGGDYNIDLGARRAASVKKALMDRGISEARMNTETFGESQPVDRTHTIEGNRLNRRVEIVVE